MTSAKNTRGALNDFFVSVQLKALRQAELATKNPDEAFDIVQDAMMRLAQKYSEECEAWPKLFQRILQNLIKDWCRKKKVRSVLFWFQQNSVEGETEDDVLDRNTYQTSHQKKMSEPEQEYAGEMFNKNLFLCLKELPLRQQQAFLLRAWWEYDTEATAFAMECSTGSVKTHYSRALKKLRSKLGEFAMQVEV